MWPWRRRREQPRAGEEGRGGPVFRGPERAYYQRLSGDYSKVSSNGKLTLTQTELLFSSRIGTDVTVALGAVVDVRDQKIHRPHVGGHDSQLVVATGTGEIGFLLEDPEGWATTIRRVRERQPLPNPVDSSPRLT